MIADRLHLVGLQVRQVAQVAQSVHTGAVKILVPLAALTAVIAAAACSSPEEPEFEPAPAPETSEEAAPEPDPAEEACELLIEGMTLGSTHVRPIALTAEGGVLDEEWEWGTLLVSIGVDARDSDDAQVSTAASQVADYGTGEVARKDLYAAGLALLDACQGAGFVDPGWVAIPWPDDDAIQSFLFSIVLTSEESELSGLLEAETFDLGLESCQVIVDEHNDSGSIPDYEWLYGQLIDLGESEGFDMGGSTSVMVGAIHHFCPEYEQIVENAR